MIKETATGLYLDILKVSSALKKRMPNHLGPWTYTKTAFGQSNPTFILNSKGKKLVLRRKPDGVLLKSAHMIDREYKIMRALKGTKVPVPNVFYLCEDKEEIGNIYFIMEFISGITFQEPQLPALTREQRQMVYDSMNAGLASLHVINPEKIGLASFGKPGNYFYRQLSRWTKQFELSMTETILEMDILKAWLLRNIPEDIKNPRIVHGDWRIDNLIFSKEDYSLSAIIDWELATLGDPRADLAGQIMQWSMPVGSESRGLSGSDRAMLGLPTDDEYVELYSRRVGLTNTPDLTFAIAFSFFRMAAILQGVKRRALDGNASNPEKAIKLGAYIPVFARLALNHLKI